MALVSPGLPGPAQEAIGQAAEGSLVAGGRLAAGESSSITGITGNPGRAADLRQN